MPKFSANLGFLWTELLLPDAILAAKRAGFAAVECHWPYETKALEVKAALELTGLPMLVMNTRRENVALGNFGVAAIPGQEEEARYYIDEVLAFAAVVEFENVHVMAGVTDGSSAAEAAFQHNLVYATEKAAKLGKTILIEPLNNRDVPGYHFSTLDAALFTLDAVAMQNLKIMFDCYHLQIMQGDLISRLQANLDNIGHIQIAAVPDRGEPGQGEPDYPQLLQAIDNMGWTGFIGAEYKPRSSTDAGPGWMKPYARQ